MSFKRNPFVTGHQIEKAMSFGRNSDILIEGIFATNDRDVQGDVITPTMLKKMVSTFEQPQPTPLYLNHYYHRPAIGKVLKAEYQEDPETGRAWVWGQALIDTNDSEIKKQIADQRIRNFSVGGHLTDYQMGYDSNGKQTRYCTDGHILELSVTPAPINIMAGFTLAKGSLLYEGLEIFKALVDHYPETIDPNDELLIKVENFNFNNIANEADEMNEIQKGNVSDFKKLSDKPKEDVKFGEGTKYGEENLESYVDPGNPRNSKNADELNQNDKKELWNKTSTSAADKGGDDLGFVDESANKFINRQGNRTGEATANSHGPYEPGNSVDDTGEELFNRFKSGYQNLNRVQKAAMVDIILHGFPINDSFQVENETDFESIHRLTEQKNRFRKGGKQYEGVVDEIIYILKGADWKRVESDPFERLIFSHLLGDHLPEFNEFLKCSGYGDGDEDDVPPTSTPEAAPPGAMGGEMPAAPPPAAPPQEGMEEGMPEGDNEMEAKISKFLEEVPNGEEIIMEILMQNGVIDQQGNPTGNEEGLETAEQQITELIEQYEQSATDQGEAAEPAMGFNKSSYSPEEIRKAVADLYDEAQRDAVVRSKVVPESQQLPSVNGKPISPTQLAMAQFMQRYTDD
jgi:hypothetical protein